MSRLAAATKPPRLTPATAGERIELIDVVRGFALYGVLLANLIWIAHDGGVTPARVAALPTAPVDRIVRLGVEFFIDWKSTPSSPSSSGLASRFS